MKKIRRILLVAPPVTRPKEFSAARVRVSPFFPLGLGYIAAVLREKGYEVRILDALLEGLDKGERPAGEGLLRYGLSDEEIRQRIEEYRPDAVGASALFSAQDFDAKTICRLAKQAHPALPTLLGGPHAGAAHREILEAEPAVDAVLIGEGEESVFDWIAAAEAGRGFERVDGIAWRAGGAVKVNSKRRYIADLDRLPLPARDMVNMQQYFARALAHDRFRQKPFTQMLTSRGCPFRCTFCALGNHWGSKQRFRSAENVLGEIDHLIERYGVREIHFEDDNLTADKTRALAICDGLAKRRHDLAWCVPTGMAVASLDEEILARMAASGCYSVTLAVESGSQEVLTKFMRKPVRLQRVPELVRAIRANGMIAKGFFMLGYPGETKETIRKTVDFARSLELDWAFFFVATPLPYTEMYEMALRQGFLQQGDFNPLTSLYESVIRTPEFDNDYIQAVREEAIVDINFRGNPNLLKYNVDQAIADFEYVLGLYPHFDFAHAALGDAFLRKGGLARAREEWKRALELNPENRDAAERLRTRGAQPGA